MAKKQPAAKTKNELNCFVVIGFGMKTDYATGRTLNLDLTYQKLIKPAFDKVGIRCFRAIDVNVTGSIDKLMYKWIYHADFVVADLSTMNANVFYELGVRHAQRPKTTLIMAENEMFKMLPFDLSHTIIYGYEHLGEEITDQESERFVGLLSDQLRKLVESPMEEDSPVFTYLPGMQAPQWTDPKELIAELQAKLAGQAAADPEEIKDQSLAIIIARAETAKNAGDYPTAIALFQTANDNDPKDIFLKQRLAMVTYKSKEKDEDDEVAIAALKEAEKILEESCQLSISNDPETLGLGGAINKRLHERTGDIVYFEKAIDCYERGFYVKQDYYNGINAAFMYTLKANLVDDEFDAIVCYGRAKMIRQKVAEICLDLVDQKGFENRGDCEWVYQTLAQAYLGMEQEDKVREILPKIEAFSKGTFDMTTFRDQNQKLIEAMDEFKRRYPAAGKSATSAGTSEEPATAKSTAVTVTGPAKPEVSYQPGGPISIGLGSHQDKPVKSIEVTCKVEFS
jgi:tetratricopeptide (TPR) repeat protein